MLHQSETQKELSACVFQSTMQVTTACNVISFRSGSRVAAHGARHGNRKYQPRTGSAAKWLESLMLTEPISNCLALPHRIAPRGDLDRLSKYPTAREKARCSRRSRRLRGALHLEVYIHLAPASALTAQPSTAAAMQCTATSRCLRRGCSPLRRLETPRWTARSWNSCCRG